MANNSGMDMSYVLDVLKGILDSKTTVDPVSQAFYKDLMDNLTTVVGALKDANAISKSELTKIAEYAKKSLSSNYGVQYTQQFKDLIDEFKHAAKNAIDNKQDIKAEKLLAGLSNIISNAIEQSLRAENRGDRKNALLKNTTEENAKKLADEIAKKLGFKGVLDRGLDKVIGFLTGQYKDNYKKHKGLLADLVDALGKGRLGKMGQDIFRLIGLMGGAWLAQFGTLGKVLGGAFYFAMESFAPILADVLIRGLAKILPEIFLGTLGKRIGLSIGAGIVTALPFIVGGNILSAKGDKLREEADKEWASGNRGRGAALRFSSDAFKLSGWGMKAGGVAVGAGTAVGVAGLLTGSSAVTAITAPIAAALIAYVGAPLLAIAAVVAGVGAAVAGIAWLWKKFHKRNQDKDEKDKEEKGFWERVIDWFKEHWPFGGGNNNNNDNNSSPTTFPGGNVPTGIQTYNTGSRGSTAQLLSGKTDISGHLDPKKMTAEDWKRADELKPVYGKMGEIVNLGQMSRKNALRWVKWDIEDKKKKGKQSYYEPIPEDLLDAGSFVTDIPYLARGTVDRIRAQKAAMIKAGIPGAEHAKVSSAIGTLGSPQKMSTHKYTGDIYGHFGSNATTYDLINTADRQHGYHLSDQQARALGIPHVYNKGKGHINHDHISLGWLNRQIESQGGQKAEAVRHSIATKALIESTEYGGGYTEFRKWLAKKGYPSPKAAEREDLMIEFLKSKGLRPDKDEKGDDVYAFYRKDSLLDKPKKTGEGVKVLTDPTGSVTFEKVKLNMQSATNKGLND